MRYLLLMFLLCGCGPETPEQRERAERVLQNLSWPSASVTNCYPVGGGTYSCTTR